MKWRTPARLRHLRGLLRAGAYLTVTSLAFGAWSLRAARAEIADRTLALGRTMAELARADNHDVTSLAMNGERMLIASSVSDDGPRGVLDRYEEHCRQSGGAEGWQAAAPPDGGVRSFGPAGLLRAGGGDEGSVLCFVRGDKTKSTLGEALQALSATGDLGYLGKLRYVYAKRNPTSGKTLILTAWTDDTFRLGQILSAPGIEAPGEDFTLVPRVPESTRALSVRAEGRPYGINVYATRAAPSAVLAFYDREMVARGYKGFDPELREAPGRTYGRDGVVVTVGIHSEDTQSFVALGLAGADADREAPAPAPEPAPGESEVD